MVNAMIINFQGTHCSGCFYTKSNAQNVLVEKFGFTQNFDVWTQLVLGIRYLDISLGYCNILV